MYNVLIFGAGSIGNHLSHGCRSKGWNVTICDTDKNALNRTKEDIYPQRYGQWDETINLATLENVPDEKFDIVIIGTPPDTHMTIAKDVLEKKPPKVLLIEKPLCSPSFQGVEDVVRLSNEKGVISLVGYNHALTKNTVYLRELLSKGVVGQPLTISAKFREYWGGIFVAHPWLSGPEDSYLGFLERGGGASGEHSHAINIWQSVAHHLNVGRVVEVSAMLDIVDNGKVLYDRICQIHVRTEKDFVGDIVQDVITEPAQKTLRVQGDKGYIDWFVNYEKNQDAVFCSDKSVDKAFNKTRPEDFVGEIDHIERCLKGEVGIEDSDISLERGLETMLVVRAAQLSSMRWIP